MFKKKKENKEYIFENNFHLNNDDYIRWFVREKYKNVKIINMTSVGTCGASRIFLQNNHNNPSIVVNRENGFCVISFEGYVIWDNRILRGYKGKSRFAKIVE